MRSLRQHVTESHVLTISVHRSSVRMYETFENPFDLVESVVDTTRPLEALVPKRGDRKQLSSRQQIARCTLSLPRGTACTERSLFESFKHSGIRPTMFMKPEEALMLLPDLLDTPTVGIDRGKRNYFFFPNSMALMVWQPVHNRHLAARCVSWREACSSAKHGDHFFVRM